MLEVGTSIGDSGPISLVAQLSDSAKILDTSDLTFSVPIEGSVESASAQFGDLKSRVNFRNQSDLSGDDKFDVVVVFSPGTTLTAESVKDLLKPNGRVCIVGIEWPGSAVAALLESVHYDR